MRNGRKQANLLAKWFAVCFETKRMRMNEEKRLGN